MKGFLRERIRKLILEKRELEEQAENFEIINMDLPYNIRDHMDRQIEFNILLLRIDHIKKEISNIID